jgi:hypothetical protein
MRTSQLRTELRARQARFIAADDRELLEFGLQRLLDGLALLTVRTAAF